MTVQLSWTRMTPVDVLKCMGKKIYEDLTLQKRSIGNWEKMGVGEWVFPGETMSIGYQWQNVSHQNIYTNNFTLTEQVKFKNIGIYIYICIAYLYKHKINNSVNKMSRNLKEIGKRYIGGFGRSKVAREKYCNCILM